jgi:hypothetical protein
LSVGIELSVHFDKVLAGRRGKGSAIFVRLSNFGKVIDREERKMLELMVLSSEKISFFAYGYTSFEPLLTFF